MLNDNLSASKKSLTRFSILCEGYIRVRTCISAWTNYFAYSSSGSNLETFFCLQKLKATLLMFPRRRRLILTWDKPVLVEKLVRDAQS